MKRAGIVLVLTWIALAASLVRSEAAEPAKIRVLLLTGGHSFKEEPFFAIFDAMPDVAYTKATLPEAAGLLKPGLEEQYDVVVRYDMLVEMKPEYEAAFTRLMEKGIGLVGLHHNLMASFSSESDAYRKILGGQFIHKAKTIDGKDYPASPWRDDEELPIEVVDSQHPITQGLSNFTIHDESYGPFYTSPAIHVLLRTNHPRNNPLVAWTHPFGKSRVFYLMLGHGPEAYATPEYQQLLHRGIQWAAGRP